MERSKGIDYVELPASDMAGTKSFFNKFLGWEFMDYGPDYCSFNDGRLDGGFYKSDQVASRDSGSVLLVFYRIDLEGAESDVKAAGGTIVKPIFSFPGGRRLHFTDPSGNEYAIWSDK